MRVSRRVVGATAAVVALGAAGVAGVEAGVLPGKYRLNGMLGANGDPVTAPGNTPGPIVQGTFRSAARPGVDEPYAIAYPPSGKKKGLPVVVMLHGRGDNHMVPFQQIFMQNYLAQYVDGGGTEFAIATLDGVQGFWINRRSAQWADLVVDFIPHLAAQGLDTSKMVLSGYSMGGYGSLMLAARQLRGRVRAVYAMSSCLWRTFAETEAGAFDSAAHFAANNPCAPEILSGLGDLPLYLTCGRNDPFYPLNTAWIAQKSPTPQSRFPWGDHSANTWRGASPALMSFAGEHLA